VVRFRDATGSGTYAPLYYTTDANHDVTAVADGAGVVQERYVYDAYGNVTFRDESWALLTTGGNNSSSTPGVSSAFDNQILYCGYRYDPETAVAVGTTFAAANYQVRGREYITQLSTFGSRDPVQADINLYRYCTNNPVIHTDPSGLWVWPWDPNAVWWWPFGPSTPTPTPAPSTPAPPPAQSPNFKPPTNPPQLPPPADQIPPGWRIRIDPPDANYPNGHWHLEKPLPDGNWQPVDPSTMKPGPAPDTHIPLPPEPPLPPITIPWWRWLLPPVFPPILKPDLLWPRVCPDNGRGGEIG
jgi:RHS repeat-associated protein